jgi:tetratricopeptide (TPR) repeat protein
VIRTPTRSLSFLWLVCFALASYSAYGNQDHSSFPDLKSLQQKDTALVLPLLYKGEAFLQTDLDSAAFYMLQAEAIAHQLEYKKGYLDFASTYIQVLNRQGKYAEALQLSQKALDVAQTLQNKSFMAVAYNNISHQYTSLGNLELALKNELEALKIAEELEDSVLIRKLTNNLASTFLDMRDKEKSYMYAKKAYTLALQLKDSIGIASGLVNLANSEVINEKYEEAEAHLNELLQLAGQIKDPSYELDALINLAHIQSELEDYQKALDYYKKLSGTRLHPIYPLGTGRKLF